MSTYTSKSSLLSPLQKMRERERGRFSMSFDGEDSRWICGATSSVNLHRVRSIVREIREPCLHHSPTKGSKMLKPEKWQAIFDCDGKVFGFRKVLKSIVLGGVDPSIRAEVWEFLLGCYALGSTFEYRRHLRMARRERYKELIKQCQAMHSSIGTGTLAYVVGSKVMDVRTYSKDTDNREIEMKNTQLALENTNKTTSHCNVNKSSEGVSYTFQRQNSNDSDDIISIRESLDDENRDSSFNSYNCFPSNAETEVHGSEYVMDSYFDFPPLPVTNLFQDREIEETNRQHSDKTLGEQKWKPNEHMHTFEISHNIDLIMEPIGLSSNDCLDPKYSDHQTVVVNHTKMAEVSREASIDVSNVTASHSMNVNQDRVSEWLWTLHRIVVDVVRTDNHLEFYDDAKNMARMSDILAVYAWIDPGTGYCQGMSDLLSPFIVLYEDNADAFWCFEMLLRRMRDNFQMEGPVGVMRQLQALWKILELTDTEIFTHLSEIGAESLHFAFRMLLVLFRRELPFNDALCMWEMMWAADFDEAATQELEGSCLAPLILDIPLVPGIEMRCENMENNRQNTKETSLENAPVEQSTSYNIEARSLFSQPFCGLARASFWTKHDQMQMCELISSGRNDDEELHVFCVAAVLVLNRQKIIKETRSIDDLIKMFNDNLLKIHVKRCVRMAIKLRKKYFYKLFKQASMTVQSE